MRSSIPGRIERKPEPQPRPKLASEGSTPDPIERRPEPQPSQQTVSENMCPPPPMPPSALQEDVASCDRGDLDTCAMIGFIYERQVSKDSARCALPYVTKACDAGHSESCGYGSMFARWLEDKRLDETFEQKGCEIEGKVICLRGPIQPGPATTFLNSVGTLKAAQRNLYLRFFPDGTAVLAYELELLPRLSPALEFTHLAQGPWRTHGNDVGLQLTEPHDEAGRREKYLSGRTDPEGVLLVRCHGCGRDDRRELKFVPVAGL